MKRYVKVIDGREVIKSANEIIVRTNGMQTINPNEAQIIADGWVEYIEPEYVPTLEDIKDNKAIEILAYDSSEAVNEFSYEGVPMWLDKETRAGLRNRFVSETAMGKTETSLWYGGMKFTLPIEMANQLLNLLENYASECYDNTQMHLANVQKLDTIEAVESYDYTIGYPAKLAF